MVCSSPCCCEGSGGFVGGSRKVVEGSNWSGDGCGVRCDFLEFRAKGGSQVFVVDF